MTTEQEEEFLDGEELVVTSESRFKSHEDEDTYFNVDTKVGEHLPKGKLSGKECLNQIGAFMSVLRMDPSIGMLFSESLAEPNENEDVLKKHGKLLGFEPDVKIRLKKDTVDVSDMEAKTNLSNNNVKSYVKISPKELGMTYDGPETGNDMTFEPSEMKPKK